MQNPTKQSYTPAQINHAVRILMDVLDDNLVLLQSDGRYLIPAVMDEHSTEDQTKIGEIQYQVSDGPVGQRSESIDFWNLEDAVTYYNHKNLKHCTKDHMKTKENVLNIE